MALDTSFREEESYFACLCRKSYEHLCPTIKPERPAARVHIEASTGRDGSASSAGQLQAQVSGVLPRPPGGHVALPAGSCGDW